MHVSRYIRDIDAEAFANGCGTHAERLSRIDVRPFRWKLGDDDLLQRDAFPRLLDSSHRENESRRQFQSRQTLAGLGRALRWCINIRLATRVVSSYCSRVSLAALSRFLSLSAVFLSLETTKYNERHARAQPSPLSPLSL